jgi:biopolymer transport protein ExbD
MIRRRHRTMSIIPLPSMADIAFLLLIFFITTSILEMEREIPLALPEALSSKTETGKHIRLWINAGGELFFNDRKESLESLFLHARSTALSRPDIRALVNADSSLPYERVNGVLETLRDAGIYNVVLVSRKKTR